MTEKGTLNNWIENSKKILKDTYQTLGGIDIKRLTVLLLALYVIYYAIEGWGRTVFIGFEIPQELQKDLTGFDSTALTQQLITELEGIRAVQEAARNLKINLVKGLESLPLRQDTLEIYLSGRINADYKKIMENIGTLEWGPFKIPGALFLRPFQMLIRQNVMHLSLNRVGNVYRISAASEKGGLWQATENDLSLINIGRSTSTDRVSPLIRILAYKLASLDGTHYEPDEIWLAFSHCTQGIRHLVTYYSRGESLLPDQDAISTLDRAKEEFDQAVTLNPKDEKLLHNLILISLIRYAYPEKVEERIKFYRSLIGKLKDLHHMGRLDSPLVRNLFIANYIFLAVNFRLNKAYADAISNYQIALQLTNDYPVLQSYICNNIGVAYEESKDLKRAETYFQKAISVHPTYGTAYLNLGNVMMERKEFTRAEEAYATAIEKHPEYEKPYYNLWMLYSGIPYSPIFQQLDQNARACVEVQKHNALRGYLSIIERKRILNHLSDDEERDFQQAKAILTEMEKTLAKRELTKDPPHIKRCLPKDLATR